MIKAKSLQTRKHTHEKNYSNLFIKVMIRFDKKISEAKIFFWVSINLIVTKHKPCLLNFSIEPHHIFM